MRLRTSSVLRLIRPSIVTDVKSTRPFVCASCRRFSVLNRPPPKYDAHVPLTLAERTALTLGSGVLSFLNPRRGDMIAAFGELTAQPYFINRLRNIMLADTTGRRILRDRPRMSSSTIPLSYLSKLPSNTVGAAFYTWLEREHLEQDTRAAVRYIDDEECAYVMQRYRESHDFYHAVTGLPTMREGEVALKAFEFANTRLPMTGLAVASVFTLKPAEKRRFWETYGPWAFRNGTHSHDVINVYWEEELETDVQELRNRLGIEQPPDLRAIRKAERDKRKAAKAAEETIIP
ncbi:coenzyme Q biosynthesis protein-like protein Coq4 [Eremomyces bilateralis CBS 781.70]|uniref:4-hydroxy-3-methoxy-5-polyprenylbenzoate decarboxylase n=1 Tax=Eremomyces bilateralis CBS 781.70 TaxID=1392243 RepID=A0A6G1G8P9_9PEZI|nr:coenzyme Q biosynthesis protein-like protein Coq4 [Eremomyces bilateralis CBS 781.70]KAF1814475.1 coenzyme Q biosynthesis protein-like protein Coq4 [Eremomyces bilateralis CBS 781.70]